jgi:hypothetical protein
MSEEAPLLGGRRGHKIQEKLYNVFLTSYVNTFLVFVPLGIVAGDFGLACCLDVYSEFFGHHPSGGVAVVCHRGACRACW